MMADKPRPEPVKDVPEVVVNKDNGKQYLRGKFLGKGGFARCYELTDLNTNEIFAGKVVSKTLLVKKHQKDKMAQEISIHRSLGHKHVVGFHCYFEDSENVYILLELCRKRSLMELHKRRRAITEPEARYFVHQLVDACVYLHDVRVIHRDLKLGNLFLSDDMDVKVGDFGLATKLDFDGERKKTLCGTPNYIAPEMLGKKGHSYEVDIWAIGCILYTLLVGKPPFETQSLKDTYTKIKKNDYHVPSRISASAKHLINRLLHPEPERRPTIHEVMNFDFFTQGYLPAHLPASCLTMAPKFSQSLLTNPVNRKALTETTNKDQNGLTDAQQLRKDLLVAPVRSLNPVPEDQVLMTVDGKTEPIRSCADTDTPLDFFLADLYKQLTTVIASKPSDRALVQEDEAEDPAATPVFWVSKWVDYSDKYGLGYQLCDNSVGVLFNDSTRLVLNGDGVQIQYIEKDGNELYYKIDQHPEVLTKKITLLKYFRSYMNEHLLKAGGNVPPRDGDELARLPYLRHWIRTRSAIVLHLTNGTLQINFFQDHTKVILCPLMSAVTYIDENRTFKTFRFSLIEQFGCSQELASRLRYARTMVERLLSTKTSLMGNCTGKSGGTVSLRPQSAVVPMIE